MSQLPVTRDYDPEDRERRLDQRGGIEESEVLRFFAPFLSPLERRALELAARGESLPASDVWMQVKRGTHRRAYRSAMGKLKSRRFMLAVLSVRHHLPGWEPLHALSVERFSTAALAARLHLTPTALRRNLTRAYLVATGAACVLKSQAASDPSRN